MEKVVSFLSPAKGARPKRMRSSQKSETTTLSPEIHRLAFLFFLRLLAPTTISFLATDTPLATILGIWYPISFAFYLLQRQETRVLFGKTRLNEHRLWLHYWSIVASWQFLRRTIINPALQSTFGLFFLLPWNVKQTLLSSLAQLELFGYVLLLYPIIHSKRWDGTIRLTTAQWHQSSFIYRMWERHVLSKIVTTEATLSLLASACASFSLAPSKTTDKDDEGGTLSQSRVTPADQHPPSDATSAEEISYYAYLERIFQKLYQLATQIIGLALWVGLISEETVASAKALWFKVGRVPAGLVLPPLFLAVLPMNFCAQLGLQYLQWIYTASFSLKAASSSDTKEDIAGNGDQKRKLEETYWLQYWIIHSTLVFGGLDYVSSQLPYWFKGLILWKFWLTFAWIWVQHDCWVVHSMFDILATELVGLGLVADEVDSKSRYNVNRQDSYQRANISETRTFRFFQYLLQQLPRASNCSNIERACLAGMEQDKRGVAQEQERSFDVYPDLTEASSSLSAASSVSSSSVASSKQSFAKDSAWISTTSELSNQASAERSMDRKKMLIRYRQHRSNKSYPASTSTK